MSSAASLLLWLLTAVAGETACYQAELVFPLDPQHNHAPGIVECPNGDLLCSWYRGSGERSADDVAVFGARLAKGASRWSEPFLMADRPGFPDCNTCMMIDRRGRLWLFWPTILANTWESCASHNTPSSPSQINAGRPPTRLAMTGRPAAHASSTTIPKGSWIDGRSKTLAA